MIAETFPLEIKSENRQVTVKIYSRMAGEYRVYEIADYSSGRRVMKCRTDLEKAKKEAKDIANAMAKGEGAATVSGKQAASYFRAVDLLKPTGMPLEVAASHYAEAFKILGGDNVIEAAKFYSKRNPAKMPQKSVQEIFDEFYASKKARGTGERHLADLKYRLGRFAKDFQTNISNVTGQQIQDWLNMLGLANGSYINFRRVIGSLFKFAIRRGYLPKDFDELDRVEKVDAGDGEITIFTPDELKRLLAAASPDFLPSLAIAAFAGLRPSEIERLDWQQVDLKRKFITVKGARKRGTPSRRVVPVSRNLAAWLKPYAKKAGKVWTGGHDEFYDAQQATAAATAAKDVEALKWKHNAPRHSFISYRLPSPALTPISRG